jgi:hypothetical protein
MKKTLKVTFGAVLVLAVIALGFLKFGVGMFANKPVYETSDGAIGGYDPVAYFTAGKPVRGSDAFTLEWQGAQWKFASAENRELFRTKPENYAPQFGGYCAYAVAHRYTARTNPEAWMVVDGQLYLNFDAATREKWAVERDRHIREARSNWPGVLW